jgi:tetratricopeptide (TPR) repeat protein
MMSHRPTPYSIALAALISMHCDEDNSALYMAKSRTHTDVDYNTVDSFLQGLVLNAIDHTDNWSQIHDTRVGVLVKQFQNCGVGYEVSQRFMVWLRLASSSIDALTDLIANVHRCISDGFVDTSSTNGIYMRSVCLGFDELSFESTARLWKDFRNETSEIYEHDDNDDDDHKVKNNDLLVKQEWTFSSDQIEDAIRKHCVTKHFLSENSSDILQQLNRIIEHNPELPSSHFMRFLLCLDSGERVGAVDALHRYVDYVLINTKDHVIEGTVKTNINHQRNEEILQFAAILKAALHSSFGDRALAIASTEEAVRIAQQSQDSACVAFALGWLAMNASNSSNSLELIKRCIHRATEANLCSLSAGANLTLACCHGIGNHSQSSNIEGSESNMYGWNKWSDALSGDVVQSTDVESSRWDRPTNISHMNSFDEALEIIGRQTIVAAGIWDSYGQISQSSISSLLSVYGNGNSLTKQEIRVCIQNIGRRALVGSPSILCYKLSQEQNSLYNQLQSLDHNSLSNATTTSSDDVCVYGDALRQMIGYCDACNLSMNSSFTIESSLIIHEWALRRGDLCQAEAMMQVLQSELSSRIPDYDLVYMDIISQQALLRSRQGRHEEAKHMLNQQLHQMKSNHILKAKPQAVRLLLLLSLIHLESSNQQHCMSAIAPLHECMAISKECGMEGIYAVALSLFAQIYLQRGNYQRCIAVIQAVLPTLLQQEHVWYQAEAYLTLGKCYLKKAKRYSESSLSSSTTSLDTCTNNRNGKNCFKAACHNLQRCNVLFRRCHDMVRLREVYYLLARIYNHLHHINGDDGMNHTYRIQRDDTSQQFLTVSNYLAEALHQSGQPLVRTLGSSIELQKLAMRGLPI